MRFDCDLYRLNESFRKESPYFSLSKRNKEEFGNETDPHKKTTNSTFKETLQQILEQNK